MMKKYAFVPIILLLLASVASAQPEDTEEYTTGDFLQNEVLSEIESEGGTFIESFEVAGSATPRAVDSVFSAFYPGYCGEEWLVYYKGTIITAWLWPSVIVAMIIIFAVTVLYMGGQLLQSPKLIATAKDEFYQSIVTIVRVLFIIGIVLGANTFYSLAAASTSGDAIYQNNPDMIDAAMAFARSMTVEMIQNYGLLVMYNMAIHTIYSSTMWVGVSFRAMYNFNLGPVLKPLIDIIGTALQYLSLAISEWMVHIITLCFIKRWTFTLLLPLGMLLRAIPYTRNAGEALFMLVMALAVLYPFMFIFDYEAHKIMSHYLVDVSDGLATMIARSGIFAIGGTIVVIALLAGGVIFPFFFGGALNIAFELIRISAYYIIMMGMLLPFLNIFVTLTLAREWARTFDVNVNYMSFMKVI